MQRKLSFLPNAKMQTRILVAFSFVVLLAVVCFSVFSRSFFFERFEAEATRSTQQLCIKISENIDTYIDKINEITKRLMSDPPLLEILNEVNGGSAEPAGTYRSLYYSRRLGEAVSNAISLTAFPHLNVIIYSREGKHLYSYRQGIGNIQGVLGDAELSRGLEKRKLIIVSDAGSAGEGKAKAISFMRSVFDFRASQYGFLEIQDDLSRMAEICDINESGNVMIADSAGRLLYTDGAMDQTDADSLITEIKGGDSGYFRRGNGEIFFYAQSKETGVSVFIKYSMASVYSSITLMKNLTVSLIVAVSLVCLLLVFLFAKKLVKPIQDLKDSVLSVNYENMGFTVKSFDNNEIVMLGNAFQHILGELRAAADKEIAASRAEADARFTALQAQIAPHFIHNVLYSIGICAREDRPDDVAFMCKQLSDMLRYTINPSKNPVTLKEEIACLKNYLTLESKNYEDSLFYEVSASPETENIRVPRLSIQPFVENCLQHAFKMCVPPYWIRIRCEMLDGGFRITIADNGVGMDEAALLRLEQKIHDSAIPGGDCRGGTAQRPGMAGMGIANSILRLKLLYGQTFRYSVSASPEGGTEVVLEGDISAYPGEETAHVPSDGGGGQQADPA